MDEIRGFIIVFGVTIALMSLTIWIGPSHMKPEVKAFLKRAFWPWKEVEE